MQDGLQKSRIDESKIVGLTTPKNSKFDSTSVKIEKSMNSVTNNKTNFTSKHEDSGNKSIYISDSCSKNKMNSQIEAKEVKSDYKNYESETKSQKLPKNDDNWSFCKSKNSDKDIANDDRVGYQMLPSKLVFQIILNYSDQQIWLTTMIKTSSNRWLNPIDMYAYIPSFLL